MCRSIVLAAIFDYIFVDQDGVHDDCDVDCMGICPRSCQKGGLRQISLLQYPSIIEFRCIVVEPMVELRSGNSGCERKSQIISFAFFFFQVFDI